MSSKKKKKISSILSPTSTVYLISTVDGSFTDPDMRLNLDELRFHMGNSQLTSFSEVRTS